MISAIVNAPTPGAARSQPSPAGPTREDVLREDRQQRDRAAEEHGEQVERDGRQEERVVADEAEAGKHVVRAVRRAGRRRATHRQRAQHQHEHDLPDRGGGEGPRGRSRRGDQESAHRRAADRGELEVDDSQALALANSVGCEELRQDGVHRRRRKCASGADQREQRIDRERRPLQPRHQREPDRGEGHQPMREDRDVAARVAIRGVSRDHHQQQHRRQLHDADQAERPGIAGAFVQLPADGDVDHLPARDRGEPADGERANEGVAQRGVGVDHERWRRVADDLITSRASHAL